MAKRIAMTVIGTQGDVQPFVALAVTLKKRGYDVVLGTSDDFRGFVTAHGVEFYSLGMDVQAFLRRASFDSAMTKSIVLYAPGLMRDGAKILKEAGQHAWEMAQDADALIFQNATTFCIDIAEALHIPALQAQFQPLNPTDEFPYFEYHREPLDPWFSKFNREPFAKGPIVDPVINKLTYMFQKAQQSYWDWPRDGLRRTLLGLSRKKRGGAHQDARGRPIVSLNAYSPTISPAPGDWPDTNVITGFWRLDDVTGWQPDAEFRAFLDRGDPPIYLGFGSMPWGAQRNTEIITRALSMWGGRAVVGKGWGGLKSEMLPDTVFTIDAAPHSKLFQYMKAVVHHGGAGTTHTGAYAGKPTFIVSHFFDQPYWGQQMYELGVGPKPAKLRKLTPQILAGALEDLASTPSYEKAAVALSEKLKLEDGTNYAVDVIEETIADYARPVEARAAESGGARRERLRSAKHLRQDPARRGPEHQGI